MQKNVQMENVNLCSRITKFLGKYAAVVILLCSAFTTQAQTWNNTSINFDWYNATNWTPNTAAGAWLPTSSAQFIDAGTKTVGIDFSQGNLSIAAISASFNPGGGGTSGDIIIGNSSATPGVLTLNGNGILYSAYTNLYLKNNNTGTGKTMDIALVQPVSTISGTAGSIFVESNITGVGKGIRIGVASLGFSAEFSGANTYTGLTTIAGGGGSNTATLTLNHPGGGTLPGGNDVSVEINGLLRVNTNQTLHDVTLSGVNSGLSVGSGATLTITGKLTTEPGRISVSGTGKIVYAAGATLSYWGYGNPSVAEFPSVDGPTNLIVSTGVPMNLPGNRVLTGTLTGPVPLKLGNFNLTVSAVTVPGSIVVTNGTGKLFITGTGTAPVTYPLWPDLNGSNYITISNGQGLTYGVRVETGINPAIANNANAVNRTWHIEPSATPVVPVNVSFAYANTHGNAGFNYTAPVELGQLYNANTWKVVKNNITQTQPVATDIVSLTGNTNSAFVIANIGAVNPVNNGIVEWINTGNTGDWYNATNWTPNTAAGAWLPTSTAQFIDAGVRTIGIDFSQGNLSVDAIRNNVQSTNGGMVVIGNSSTTPGTLTLNSAIASYQSSLTIQNNSTGTGKTLDIALGQSITINPYLTIIKIESNISGVGKGISVSAGGGGTVELTGQNSYTGLTTLTGGGGSASALLRLNRPGGGTLPAGNSVEGIDKGRLEVLTDQTLNNVTLGSFCTLNVGNGATLTITGKLKIRTGTVTVDGTGRIAYGPGATLEYWSGDAGVATAAEWPAVDGPTNVINNVALPTMNIPGNRVITGTLTGLFTLNNFNLTAAVVTYPGSTIITNGTGKLFITGVGTTPVIFPVGISPSSLIGLNPVTISNGQGLTYGVRVETGINPTLAASNVAVNRTWYIEPSATPNLSNGVTAPVNVSFGYASTHGNPGFNYTTPCELMQYNTTTSTWTAVQSGITQVQPLPTAITTLTGGVSSAFVIKNIPQALAINLPVEIAVKKENNAGAVSWVIGNVNTAIKEIVVERSANGRAFETLATLPAGSRTYTDNSLLNSTNYYRIKVTDVNGKIIYSPVAALLNGADGFDIVSLMPNIVAAEMRLNLTAAQKTKLQVSITDVAGRPVQKIAYTATAGSNQYDINVAHLAAGIYYLTAVTANGDAKTVRFVKQ
jgi:Secretion system C-terminal sorting domain